jgi:hypothetical protein
MTKREAKELSLELWRYLAEHPEIKQKIYLPIALYDKIKNLPGNCPLCEVFSDCADCILKICVTGSGLFKNWFLARDKEQRRKAALKIVRRVGAWKVEE